MEPRCFLGVRIVPVVLRITSIWLFRSNKGIPRLHRSGRSKTQQRFMRSSGHRETGHKTHFSCALGNMALPRVRKISISRWRCLKKNHVVRGPYFSRHNAQYDSAGTRRFTLCIIFEIRGRQRPGSRPRWILPLRQRLKLLHIQTRSDFSSSSAAQTAA